MVKVVAPPRVAQATMDGARVLHATIIKQVHRKLDVAKQVDGASLENYWQPYLGVLVTQMKLGATATKGAMMVDTGASITLVTQKWAETRGLTITPVLGISIMVANGAPVDMAGTYTMMVQLLPMLELDVGDVNISSGDFYQALICCDILGGLHAGGAVVL